MGVVVVAVGVNIDFTKIIQPASNKIWQGSPRNRKVWQYDPYVHHEKSSNRDDLWDWPDVGFMEKRFHSSYYKYIHKTKIKKKKKSLARLKSKFEVAQERIHELEDTMIEIMQAKDQREKIKKIRASEKCVGHHQGYQYMCNGSTKRRGKKREEKKSLKK